MNWETLQKYLSAQPGAVEEYPFGPTVAVHKIGGKIFAFSLWNASPVALSLKCDPDQSIALRHEFPAITAGYHLNKRHWNTIALDGSVPEDFLYDLIDHSYELVFKSLTKAIRASLPISVSHPPH